MSVFELKNKDEMINIKISSDAQRKICDFARANKAIGLRFSMKRYGCCSGMSYDLLLATENIEGDFCASLFDEDCEVCFFVDARIGKFVNGCEIDYKIGMLSEGFVFNNPNEKLGCGCGKSFNF